MTRFSISLRLALWYAGISVAGFAVFGVAMYFVLAHSMISWKDRTLQMRATRVAVALAAIPGGRGGPELNAKLSEVVGALPEGELIQVVGADGVVLFPRERTPQTPDASGVTCASMTVRDLFVGRDRFRQLCHPAAYADERVSVVAPSSLVEDRILLRNFTLGMYRTLPLILLVSGVAGYVLSRRALRPVDLLIAEARTITPDNLSRRLSVSAPDDQLRRLALEWNSLLARIDSAMERVTQFTADASHELRTPVAYIRATAEYSLGSSSLDKETRENLIAIVDEADLIGKLIENLLTIARLDLSPSEINVETISIRPVLEEVESYFKQVVKSKDQTLTTYDGTGGGTIRTNPLHLRQILSILVENAIKYTSAGGNIAVRCELLDTLRFTIEDNGIGIAAEHLPKIFDRFYRVDSARMDMRDGLGLGLPIAKLIAALCGGTIKVSSAFGIGTIFTLDLPTSNPIQLTGTLKELVSKSPRLPCFHNGIIKELTNCAAETMSGLFQCSTRPNGSLPSNTWCNVLRMAART